MTVTQQVLLNQQNAMIIRHYSEHQGVDFETALMIIIGLVLFTIILPR